jgi:hypothetical protein
MVAAGTTQSNTGEQQAVFVELNPLDGDDEQTVLLAPSYECSLRNSWSGLVEWADRYVSNCRFENEDVLAGSGASGTTSRPHLAVEWSDPEDLPSLDHLLALPGGGFVQISTANGIVLEAYGNTIDRTRLWDRVRPQGTAVDAAAVHEYAGRPFTIIASSAETPVHQSFLMGVDAEGAVQWLGLLPRGIAAQQIGGQAFGERNLVFVGGAEIDPSAQARPFLRIYEISAGQILDEFRITGPTAPARGVLRRGQLLALEASPNGVIFASIEWQWDDGTYAYELVRLAGY